MNGMKEDKTTQGQGGHEHMQCQIPWKDQYALILPDSQGYKSLSLSAVSSGKWMEESQPLIVIKGKILEH